MSVAREALLLPPQIKVAQLHGDAMVRQYLVLMVLQLVQAIKTLMIWPQQDVPQPLVLLTHMQEEVIQIGLSPAKMNWLNYTQTELL